MKQLYLKHKDSEENEENEKIEKQLNTVRKEIFAHNPFTPTQEQQARERFYHEQDWLQEQLSPKIRTDNVFHLKTKDGNYTSRRWLEEFTLSPLADLTEEQRDTLKLKLIGEVKDATLLWQSTSKTKENHEEEFSYNVVSHFLDATSDHDDDPFIKILRNVCQLFHRVRSVRLQLSSNPGQPESTFPVESFTKTLKQDAKNLPGFSLFDNFFGNSKKKPSPSPSNTPYMIRDQKRALRKSQGRPSTRNSLDHIPLAKRSKSARELQVSPRLAEPETHDLSELTELANRICSLISADHPKHAKPFQELRSTLKNKDLKYEPQAFPALSPIKDRPKKTAPKKPAYETTLSSTQQFLTLIAPWRLHARRMEQALTLQFQRRPMRERQRMKTLTVLEYDNEEQRQNDSLTLPTIDLKLRQFFMKERALLHEIIHFPGIDFTLLTETGKFRKHRWLWLECQEGSLKDRHKTLSLRQQKAEWDEFLNLHGDWDCVEWNMNMKVRNQEHPHCLWTRFADKAVRTCKERVRAIFQKEGSHFEQGTQLTQELCAPLAREDIDKIEDVCSHAMIDFYGGIRNVKHYTPKNRDARREFTPSLTESMQTLEKLKAQQTEQAASQELVPISEEDRLEGEVSIEAILDRTLEPPLEQATSLREILKTKLRKIETEIQAFENLGDEAKKLLEHIQKRKRKLFVDGPTPSANTFSSRRPSLAPKQVTTVNQEHARRSSYGGIDANHRPQKRRTSLLQLTVTSNTAKHPPTGLVSSKSAHSLESIHEESNQAPPSPSSLDLILQKKEILLEWDPELKKFTLQGLEAHHCKPSHWNDQTGMMTLEVSDKNGKTIKVTKKTTIVLPNRSSSSKQTTVPFERLMRISLLQDAAERTQQAIQEITTCVHILSSLKTITEIAKERMLQERASLRL